MFLVLSSPIIPDGMSIDTTLAGEALIYCTTAAKPPLKGMFSPVPKRPSITMSSAESFGGSNCVLTSV